jgi:hypothetical protein
MSQAHSLNRHSTASVWSCHRVSGHWLLEVLFGLENRHKEGPRKVAHVEARVERLVLSSRAARGAFDKALRG